MGQLTPAFVMDLEKNMRVIAAQEYQRLLGNLWYPSVTKTMPSGAKSERISWLLDSATIQYVSRLGGEVEFDDILSNTTEFTSLTATNGLKLNKNEFADHDGNGVDLAEQWVRQMGSYAAYWPQKQVAVAIRNGSQAANTTYDGLTFFSTVHKLNPFDSSLGTFANDFTGAASGIYPGAVPIDSSVTVDVAVNNLQAAIAYVQSGITMINGEDPRMLNVRGILAPPALSARVRQLTDAKFIAQAAATGGGAADVAAIVSGWNLGTPMIAPELSSKFTNGSDTTYYLVAEQLMGDQLGALTYVNREPFEIVYNNEMTNAELARANSLQWTIRGRNVVGYGHPYLLFRCQKT